MNLEVEFPLYARALQFCSEQDSFVRTTVMNICLNTIRLATNNNSDGSSSAYDDTNDDNAAVFFDHLSIIATGRSQIDLNQSNHSRHNPKVIKSVK